MPIYRYLCPANGEVRDVRHRMTEDLTRWGEVCARIDEPVGETDPEAPVERVIFPVGLSTPKSDSELKSMGFTQLVKRESGVYENVTALEGEKRYVSADDATSMPDFKRRKLD